MQRDHSPPRAAILDGLPVGTVLDDRYRVVRELGRGGLSTTFLVHDQVWDTHVALKLLRQARPELAATLKAEFGLLRELYHPYLCQVHDFGVLCEARASRCFYTASYIEGTSLEQHVLDADWDAVREPLLNALSALHFLHRAGLRHGDFKLGNILVRANGSGVLIDLSCACSLHAETSGVVSGSRDLLAPELLRGQAGDQRSDLFSVGATLREMSRYVRLPPEVERLVGRLLTQEPAGRPADANEVIEALGGEPVSAALVPTGLGRLAGARAELASLRNALKKMLSRTPGDRCMLLVGPDGIGKSRLLGEIRFVAKQHCRVIEANAAKPNGVSDLVGRALGGHHPPLDVAAIVDAHERLSQVDSPGLVLLVDDADALTERQSELLAALARSMRPDGPLLLLASARLAEGFDEASFTRLEVQSLTEPEVHAWLGDSIPLTRQNDLLRASGGRAGLLCFLTQGVLNGSLTGGEMREGSTLGAGARLLAAGLTGLSDERSRALAVLSVLGHPAPPERLRVFGVRPEDLEESLRHGLVRQDASGYKLFALSAEEVASALDPAALRAAHRDLAVWTLEQESACAHGEPTKAELAARGLYHCVLSGELERAQRLAESANKLYELAPQAWLKAARALAAARPNQATELFAARAEQAAGQAPLALARLENLLTKVGGADSRSAILLQTGACLLKLGDSAAASRVLREVSSSHVDAERRSEAAGLLSQALSKQGDYAQALAVAQCAEEQSGTPSEKARLREAAGVALGYLGRLSEAREQLSSAAALAEQPRPPRDEIRSWSARALVEFRAGDLPAAAEYYSRALQTAEGHGLDDQTAMAALNSGVVHHQMGEWAEALHCYERGMRIAAARRQTNTEAHLRVNLAKLYADIGSFERASLCAARCLALCEKSGLGLVAAASHAVLGQLALAEGRLADARVQYGTALERFARSNAVRECIELELDLAEVALVEGDVGAVDQRLADVAKRWQELTAPDIGLRLDLLESRKWLALAAPAKAVPAAERALATARKLGQQALENEVEQVLAVAWRAQGSELLADKHAALAREGWERIAVRLPESIREVFWRHPRRAHLTQEVSGAKRDDAASRERKFERLVHAFRRLNSSLRTRDVVERAMDAAIELTRAERGFLLLSNERKGVRRFRVAVARNLDKEHLERSHLKFSRAIAERAIGSGEPIVTACAQADERFEAHESVHAMQLKSVIAVPVVSPEGTLGALYLDNRFQSGRFDSEDVDLLVAFADQVAVALRNARLHHELNRRNRELIDERKQIERMLRAKEAEVVRLEEAADLRVRQIYRYDYSAIVARSAAMQPLFALLDRVIGTDLPILVQGESGTGKELIARAIHSNHPERKGPFVSINCGAVPEALLESELFGYERGAFTGAERAYDGLLVQAKGGTLFLDELGEMPLAMQVKLLRVLQEREVRPLGSPHSVSVDIRLVCATNRRLREEVARGTFREDLYYRIAGVELTIPPLRERRDDIPLLVHHHLVRAAGQLGRAVPEISADALHKLSVYPWPGNVRQLQNALTRALVMVEGDTIEASHIELPEAVVHMPRAGDRASYEQQQLKAIEDALLANNWNVAKVARSLGVSRPTLYRRMRQRGLIR